MGVLDDAIREHLELKRQHGARDSEIKELEDEAFGPPSRPGEPDFPDRDAAPPVGPEGAEALEPEPQGAAAPEVTVEDVGSVGEGPSFEAAEAPVTEPSAPEAPPAGADQPTELMEPAFEEEPAPARPLEDPAMEEDLGVEDLDLRLDEDAELDEGAETELLEGEISADEDEADEPLLDAELALPGHEAVGPAEELAAPPLPTEEHPYPAEDLLEEDDEAWTTDEPEPGAAEPQTEEDVLEETPEFLRDAPENEELWFEQGEPQDFDFEDEDEDEGK